MTTSTGIGGTPSTGGEGGTDIPRIEDTGSEACPGEAYSLTLPSTRLRLAGTTIDADNDYEVFGEDLQTRGGDRVYALNFDSSGSLRIVLRNTSATNDPKLYILSEDRSPPNDSVTFGLDTLSLNVACPSRGGGDGGGGNQPAPPADILGSATQLLGTLNAQPAGEGESLVAAVGESIQLPVFAIDVPGTIQLVVDGLDGPGFDYELDIDFTPSQCGDEIVNEGETCDDGNTVAMDGCSANCLVEPNELFDRCPGQSISNLTLDNPVVIATGSTLGRSDASAPSCAGEGGRDRVYAVSIGESGVLSATVGLDETGTTPICASQGLADRACWDAVVYIREGDCELGTEVACDTNSTYQPVVASTPVTPGTYYVFVDASSDFLFPPFSGAFFLKLELAPPGSQVGGGGAGN
ncbi:MAG: DUF4215 domain-containing protein [Myxococcota bacterium]